MMKHKLLFLIPLLFAVMLLGCLKSNPAPQPPALTGKFAGEFRYLHRSTNKTHFDTTKTNVTVNMNADGTYSVTSDTTVHADSHGTFTYGAPYIDFKDQTALANTNALPTNRLNGYYIYYYDGTAFQMLAYSVDTLSLQYDLKRTQ